MIRNVVVHILNEQPLLADLYELPKSEDQGLLCTNLRMMDGKKPIFIDRIESVFFFPYLHIRFVEIPPASLADTGLDLPVPVAVGARPTATESAPAAVDDADLEIDEDFLRRIREA